MERSRTPASRVADREDFRGATPVLEEDFHHPCPTCETELVILASQPIRRVNCPGCQGEFTLDKRIGGELCLLPFDSKEYRKHRALVAKLKEWKLRIAIYAAAAVAVGCGIAVGMYVPLILVAAGAIASVHVIVHMDMGQEKRKSKPRGRRKRKRHRDTR